MKKLFYLTKVFFVTFLFIACDQDELYSPSDEEHHSQLTVQSKAVVVEGVIPFTVENVYKALPNVIDYYKKSRPEVAERFADYKVGTTHIYYKFTPQDSLQYSRLMEDDKNLQLTNHPFEYAKIEQHEDPGDHDIPLFYAVVDATHRVPDVPYEIIAELHFTDEDKLEDIESNYDEVEFKQNLMYEARKLAGHLDDEELREGYMNYLEGFEDENNLNSNLSPKGLFGTRWRPSGTILVEDDWLTDRSGTLITRGVYRVKVNVLKWGWLSVESGHTDVNGNFSTGRTYTNNVHYNVKFTDSDRVTVRPGNFYATANWKSDSHRRRRLDYTFRRNSRAQFYALITNAACDYFNRVVSTYGIYNPTTIDISGHFNDHKSNYWFGWVPFRSEVKIGGMHSNGVRKRSDAIYATVIHEITHKSHYKMDSDAFSGIAGSGAKHMKFLRESWVVCVETRATNDRYGLYFNQHALGNYIASVSVNWHMNRLWKTYLQYQQVAHMNEYSPAFIDLMDNVNQRGILPNLPQDRVSGYTLQQLQTALNGSHTIALFGNKLKLLYNNPTEQFVDDVVEYSQTVINNM